MQLRSLELRPLTFRLDAPVHTARGTHTERSGWRVWITLADGRVAVGEATPLTGFGTESLAEAEVALRDTLDRLAGAALPDSLEAIESRVAELIPARAPASRYGLELALLDALGQLRGVSVAELLGGAQDVVPIHTLVSGKATEEVVAEGRAALAQGFRTLKLKLLGGAPAVEAARTAALRQAVGPGVALRVDANGAWNLEQARAHLDGIASSRIETCEQPLPAGAWALLQVLRGPACAIAADESLALPEAVEGLLSAPGKIDVIVLKPTVLGGLLRTVRLARRAASVGVRSYVTHSLEGAVGRVGAAQVAAVVHGLPASGALAAGVQLGSEVDPDVHTDAYRCVDGALRVPRLPGLGLTLPIGKRGAA